MPAKEDRSGDIWAEDNVLISGQTGVTVSGGLSTPPRNIHQEVDELRALVGELISRIDQLEAERG